MWPFTSDKWKKLGNAWDAAGIVGKFKKLSIPPTIIESRDRTARALPKNKFLEFSWKHWTPTDYPSYKPEIFDCDDFAICYIAAIKRAWAKTGAKEPLAFGYIDGKIDAGGHAWAWAMDNDGKIFFIEPQTGELMTRQVLEIWTVEI